MPRSKKKDKLIDEGVRHITMAIREEMMEYFKGTCVNKLSPFCGVRTVGVSFRGNEHGERHYYLRREHEQEDPRRIVFADTVIGEVRHNDDRAVFYPGVMNRSPEFAGIYEQVRDFFGKYLQGVQLSEDTANGYNDYSDGSRDRRIIERYTVPQIDEEVSGPDHEFPRGRTTQLREYDNDNGRVPVQVGFHRGLDGSVAQEIHNTFTQRMIQQYENARMNNRIVQYQGLPVLTNCM